MHLCNFIFRNNTKVTTLFTGKTKIGFLFSEIPKYNIIFIEKINFERKVYIFLRINSSLTYVNCNYEIDIVTGFFSEHIFFKEISWHRILPGTAVSWNVLSISLEE